MSDNIRSQYNQFLTEHLKMWMDSGVSAPKNEVQSIQAWLSCLTSNGAEETIKRMRARLVLLMGEANNLHKNGLDTKSEIGIYNNRPDLDPTK